MMTPCRQRMAASSLKNAARFSWRRAADETEKIFDAILGNGRTRHVQDFTKKGRWSYDRSPRQLPGRAC